MILLRNKSDTTRAILIALDDNDEKVLQFAFNNHIMWGFYNLTHISDKNNKEPFIAGMLKLHPTAKAIAHLSCPEGFVPRYEKEEIK